MKTSQLMCQDNNNSVTLLYSLRFDSVKTIAAKRPPTSRPALNNPSLKNPKHLAVLHEYNINFDQPLNPIQVAANRAERIAKEKKQNLETQQRQQQAAAASEAQRTAAATAAAERSQAAAASGVTTPTVTQTVTAQPQLHSLVPVSGTPTSTLVVSYLSCFNLI